MNECLNCEKPTLNPKFCSKSCSAQHTNKTNPRRKLTNKCQTCNVLIRSTRTYCSRACYPERKRKRLVGYERVKEFRQRIKLKAIDYLGGKCKICGYSRCATALEFHHLDPAQKEFAISSKTRAWEVVQAELDKCALLCCRCHREVHDGVIGMDGFAPSCD